MDAPDDLYARSVRHDGKIAFDIGHSEGLGDAIQDCLGAKFLRRRHVRELDDDGALDRDEHQVDLDLSGHAIRLVFDIDGSGELDLSNLPEAELDRTVRALSADARFVVHDYPLRKRTMPKTVITPPGTGTPIAPFSPGTLADGVVYVSGTLAFDKDNNVAHVGDAAAQTRQVLETIKSVIETAGGTMDDVTMNHIFLKDWADYAAINKVYAEYFPGEKPARFCIQCGLVRPDFLVEIATIAHIGKP